MSPLLEVITSLRLAANRERNNVIVLDKYLNDLNIETAECDNCGWIDTCHRNKYTECHRGSGYWRCEECKGEPGCPCEENEESEENEENQENEGDESAHAFDEVMPERLPDLATLHF